MISKMRKYQPVAIELAIAVACWFVWKPLTGFFVILAAGGFVRDVALGNTAVWARKAAFSVGIVYGLVMALIVGYGSFLWGNGLIETIGLGFWGFIAVGYVAYGYPPYSRLNENRYVVAMGADMAYVTLALTLFLVPSLR